MLLLVNKFPRRHTSSLSRVAGEEHASTRIPTARVAPSRHTVSFLFYSFYDTHSCDLYSNHHQWNQSTNHLEHRLPENETALYSVMLFFKTHKHALIPYNSSSLTFATNPDWIVDGTTTRTSCIFTCLSLANSNLWSGPPTKAVPHDKIKPSPNNHLLGFQCNSTPSSISTTPI